MLKAVVAATAAVTIAGSSMAYAQRDERAEGARRWQPTTEDMRAFQAARLAALRAGLTLTPEQDKHWPAFEQAMRELQQLRLNRITAIREARRDGRRRSPIRPSACASAPPVCRKAAPSSSGSPKRPIRSTAASMRRRGGASPSSPARKDPRGWQRRGRDGGERGMPRGHRRTDATPDRRNADFYAQDRRWRRVRPGFRQQDRRRRHGWPGVRHQDRRRRSGDWRSGGVSPARPWSRSAFGGKLTAVEPGTFGAKLTSTEGATFGRKITIGEPAGIRAQGGDEYLTNFASAAVVLPAPRHDRRRMGAAGFNRPAAFPF